MALVYKDAFGSSATFDVAFPSTVLRLGNVPGLQERAEHLQAGAVSLTFDDPNADLGNAGDAILAQARLSITELDCTAGNQRLFTGIFGVREYGRRADAETDSLRTGVSREIVGELHDLNSLLSFPLIPNDDTAANRPAETVDDRMAWIVASSYLTQYGIAASSDFESSTTQMTANDYRSQRPANVINDCEMAAGFGWNAFVRWNETTHFPNLCFFNANTSTLYTSTLSFSNVLADQGVFTDPATTVFGVSKDARLHRDPTDLGSGVLLPFKNNAAYYERAATVLAYGRKDIMAPNANVSSLAAATALATDFAFQHSTEEDRITVTVDLPSSKVTLIKAGMRAQFKFSHLPGYTSYTYMRVLSCAPAQERETPDRYQVHLELSPQEDAAPAAPCSDDATPAGIYYPLGGVTPGFAGLPNLSDGVVYYFRPGLGLPLTPTPGWQGNWHFPNWGAGGVGTVDQGGSCVENSLVLMSVGNGTWGIHTYAGGTARFLDISTGPTLGTLVHYTTISPGDDAGIDITDATDGDCVRLTRVTDSTGTCGGYWGWTAAEWTPA